MSETPESPLPAVPMPALNADAVFFALGHPGRRRLLESLSQRRSCTAAELVPVSKLKRDSISQQLQELVKAGLMTLADDSKDARRQRYTLHPRLTAAKSATGVWEMDLGCCVLRWS